MSSAARPAVVTVALLALVAAGCGGSSSDKKANEAYANSVCSAVADWEKQVKQIATDFSGGISKASLQKKVGQAEAATRTLASELKAASPPDTDQGKAARQQLAQLSDDATSSVDAAKSAIAQVQGNASAQAIAAAVAGLLPQVQRLVGEAKSTIATLQSAKGSLASAFRSADSCQSLA
jgi:hypothetical protein